MDNLIELIEYKGYDIKIYHDPDPIDPIDDFDWLGTIVCWHGNYNIGHKHNYFVPDDFMKSLANEANDSIDDKIEYWESGNGWRYLDNKYGNEYDDKNNQNKAVYYADERINKLISKAIDKHYIMLNIYMYEHSGITIRTYPFNCHWDSGQIGYIYVSKKKVKEEYGWKVLTKKRITQIEEYLKNEVKTYDQYLTGEVYEYEVIDPVTNETIDSCSGFYGNDFETNGLMEYAKSAIDYEVKEQEKMKAEMHNEEIGDCYI